jgi:hypothetical protein
MAATTSPPTTAPLPLTRHRRAALLIGVPVCLALVAYTGLDLVAVFGEGSRPVGGTAPAATRALTVTSPGGQLTIKPAASGQARLAGTARYSLIGSTLSEHTAGGTTAMDYHCVLPVGDCGLDATVSVPAAMPVSANVGGGNVTVTGTTGPVTLSSGGGDLSADHTAGPLTLNTSGGNIQAADVSSASVTASTGGGNIEIVFTGVPRDVHVSTSGGNVTLILPRGATSYHVTTSTGGGDVTDRLPYSASSSQVITATSGGGNITLLRQ